MIPPDFNRQELHELAPLNVFGLLEEYDETHFDRSYRNASVAEQQSILEYQETFAADEALLPASEPSADLRSKVLDRLQKEIDRANAPVGHVGPVGRTTTQTSDVVTADVKKPDNSSTSNTKTEYSLMWRAAAFVLSGAVVVLAYFSADANGKHKVIAELVLEGSTYEQVASLIGGDFSEFSGNPNCKAVVLNPTGATEGPFDGVFARAYHNEQTNELFLAIVDLPQNAGPYRLRMVSSDGRTTEHAINGNHLLISNVLRTAFDTMAIQIINADGLMIMTA